MLFQSGVDGKPTVFLLPDTQIRYEVWLDDISTILNTGDVPNLFAPEEKAEILERIQVAAKDQASIHVSV